MRKGVFFLAMVLASAAALAGENWPQFRGPSGQGMSDALGLPTEFGEGKTPTNIKWEVPIHGKAWSSPVIWGNQIWMTTATEDGKELGVVRVDKETGKITLDKKLYDIPNPQYCIPFNSYASPTPVIEEGRIYVTWGSPGTACLDTSTGNLLWERRDFVCNHFRSAGSSPLLYRDLLILNFDGSDYQYVAAMDKKTGSTVWKTDRSIDFKDLVNGQPQNNGDMRKAFSTPRVIRVDGHDELISVGSKCVYAYDPATGKELWRVENRTAHSGSATPVIGDGIIYDNVGHGRAEVFAIRPGGHGVVNNTNVLWKYYSARDVPTRSSGILVNNRLYYVGDSGIVTCLNIDDGKPLWRARVKGNYSAAPLSAENHIYFFSEDGHCTVIAANGDEKEMKVLGESQLGDGFMASPAASGNALYLRSRTHLYRIEK